MVSFVYRIKFQFDQSFAVCFDSVLNRSICFVSEGVKVSLPTLVSFGASLPIERERGGVIFLLLKSRVRS